MVVNTRSKRKTKPKSKSTVKHGGLVFDEDELESPDRAQPKRISSAQKDVENARGETVFDEDELESPKRASTNPGTKCKIATNGKSGPVFEEDELASTSEESDVDVDEEELADAVLSDAGEEEIGASASAKVTSNMDWSPTDCGDVSSDEYKMFLRSILGEGEGGTENGLGEVSEEALAALLDGEEDNDYDYMAESNNDMYDPYEYRDDRGVHVSTKEVIQLVQPHDSLLRPRTRHFNSQPAAIPRQSIPTTVPRIAPLPVPTLNGPQPLQTPQPTNPLFSVTQISVLQDQYTQHIHLLAAIHADASKLAAGAAAAEANPAETLLPEAIALPERSVEDAKKALSITIDVIKSLQTSRNIALSFWNMVAPASEAHSRAMTGGAPFASRNVQQPARAIAQVGTLFDSPAIRLLDQFVEYCKNTDWNSETPLGAVQRLQPHLHPLLAQRLVPRPVRTSRNSNNEPNSLPDWNKADDALLLMTLQKHSRAFGPKFADLLPHRSEQNCVLRLKTLSSRRVCDNPIKRFVLDNAAPLSRTEIANIQDVMQHVGPGGEHNQETWEFIQREYFPTREVSMLQKMWETREKRRKYKSDYRQKLRKENELKKVKKSLHKNRANGASKRPRTITTRVARPQIVPVAPQTMPAPYMPARTASHLVTPLPLANMTRPIAPAPTSTTSAPQTVMPAPLAPAILPAPLHVAPVIQSGSSATLPNRVVQPILPAPLPIEMIVPSVPPMSTVVPIAAVPSTIGSGALSTAPRQIQKSNSLKNGQLTVNEKQSGKSKSGK